MAQKVEKLSEELLNTIKSKQTELNQIVFDLGELNLKLRDIRAELRNTDDIKTAVEARFDEVNASLKEILSDLNKKYPNGEVDLNEGAVYYESAE